jgi:hypothetical protein
MDNSFERQENKEQPDNCEQSQADKISIGESVKIGGENYVLEYKPSGLPPSSENCDFIHKQWEIPRHEAPSDLNKELKERELETVKDAKGEIIAICSYVIYKEGSPRDYYGDGHVALSLVKEEYRTKKGIGYFVTKKAVDRIIEYAKKRVDFVPPVVVKAEAFTEGGLMLMGKIEGEYTKKDVTFVVGSDRLLF